MTSEIRCPRWDCGWMNPAANFFCYYCGTTLREWQGTGQEQRTSYPAPPPMAALILPDNREIPVSLHEQWIGRDALSEILPEESVKYISRRHLVIKLESGRYYIEDQDSANGTKLNGTEIKGRGKFELGNGDLIEIAGVSTLSFKKS